ncbi:MAG TPA: cytochrome c oxidase assembly protein [Gemmatimonadales bacterium]|nr:cytochrome c oxidase assembly protein [Gemmatimonadales bacterium]
MTSTVQWWCAATGLPWTWAWQWYPGVHLALLVVAVGWYWLGRVQRWSRRPWGWFAVAWLAMLVTLDWPVGKLGAGYLASVHTLQFLLLTLLVAPAILRAIPPDGWERLAPSGSRRRRILAFQARALPGLILYNAIVITTHFPSVVDAAMASQVGSFLIDGSWLLAGLILWWPILGPPAFRRLGMFAKMGYLFGATIVPTIPAMMMVFSRWPLYELYELAPRVDVRFSANEDIQLAGLVMKLFGDLPLWIATAVVFFTESAERREATDVARAT